MYTHSLYNHTAELQILFELPVEWLHQLKEAWHDEQRRLWGVDVNPPCSVSFSSLKSCDVSQEMYILEFKMDYYFFQSSGLLNNMSAGISFLNMKDSYS